MPHTQRAKKGGEEFLSLLKLVVDSKLVGLECALVWNVAETKQNKTKPLWGKMEFSVLLERFVSYHTCCLPSPLGDGDEAEGLGF